MKYPGATLDATALQARIKTVMPMVKKIAWHVHGRVGRALEIDDLVQAGMVGLVEAANRSQHVPDEEFSIYASQRIRGAVIDFVRRHAQLSRVVVQRKKQLREARKTLAETGQREPSAAELAAHLNIHEQELRSWEEENAGRKVESLDELNEAYGMWIAHAGPGPDEEIEREQLAQKLEVALAGLSDRLKLVMQLYYVEELNLREIAEVMDVSVGRVSQLKTEAAQQIYNKLRGDFALD